MIGDTIPTSLLVLVEAIFTPLVSVLIECQLHIMKIKSFILGTLATYMCNGLALTLHAVKL